MAADWFRSLGFTMPYGVNVAGEARHPYCCHYYPATRSVCSGLVYFSDFLTENKPSHATFKDWPVGLSSVCLHGAHPHLL